MDGLQAHKDPRRRECPRKRAFYSIAGKRMAINIGATVQIGRRWNHISLPAASSGSTNVCAGSPFPMGPGYLLVFRASPPNLADLLSGHFPLPGLMRSATKPVSSSCKTGGVDDHICRQFSLCHCRAMTAVGRDCLDCGPRQTSLKPLRR